ncbi:uncharacterized protein LOC109708688 [Ananas comosus]|uniref:Uncharacterized protein LOC109708688 n=1 Tax=Ananas comosus TaxID=4615 RepID=A0A6P5EY26_ANACO|nr:uncharacterized protein LOC109708688 [Ananas comosus]
MYTMLSLQHVSTVHYFRVAFLFSFWVFYFAKANDPPNVFDVTHYGADVDREDNKAAFLAAWKAACNFDGTSRLLIPNGTFNLGPVEFRGPCKNNIAPSVEIKGSLQAPLEFDDFPDSSWIKFNGLDKLAVTGGGTLDGQGARAWSKNKCDDGQSCDLAPTVRIYYFNAMKDCEFTPKSSAVPSNQMNNLHTCFGHLHQKTILEQCVILVPTIYIRVTTLKFEEVSNSTISLLKLVDSKAFHMNFHRCEHINIHDLNITAPGDSPNTDGIHVGGTSHIRIRNSVIGTGDDCISIGPGSKDVLVSNVTCGPGHGISVGSLGKYDNETDVIGLLVENCTVKNTTNGVRIKTWPGSSASLAQNFTFSNITMINVSNPIIIDQEYCPLDGCSKKPSRVQISNVTFENITGTSTTKIAVNLLCSRDAPCKNVELADIKLVTCDNSRQCSNTTSSCLNVNGSFSGAEGTRGGLLTAWNPTLFDCVREHSGRFSLTVVLKRKVDGKMFMITNVHGPTAPNLKADFFLELRSISATSSGAWVVLGDFNVLLSIQDKNGPTTNINDILSFRETVQESGLIDIPIANKSFTWSNGRVTSTLERLDRVFISNAWTLVFPRSALRALPRPRSDHTPLVLSSYTSANLFRFEAFWLRHPALRGIVAAAWRSVLHDTNPVNLILRKIESVQSALRSWSADISLASREQGKRCLLWIEWLDKAEEYRPLTTPEYILRPKLKTRYEDICLQEEIKWKQRSRVQWLKVGDANTKFFHQQASARRSKNFISRLSTGSSTFTSPDQIAGHLLSFFRNQLGVQLNPSVDINLHAIYADQQIDLSSLHAPFTISEVKTAVFSSAPEKAPGPDGLPMLFYQHFWNLIKDDIMGMFNNFYNGLANLTGANTGWLCLVPKKNEALSANDFLPISLIHSVAKLISKVLASRLQNVLGGLINSYQAAFLKGRHISDNFNCAHILIHHLYTTKQRAALLKIDFERAFDQVDWSFLLDLLQARGFSQRWISWIRSLLHSASTSVILNGTPGRSFPCRRGLRQGDPLSPLLFILCVDVLYRLIQIAVTEGLLPDVGIGNARLHTLQFADDLIIFFDGSTRSAAIVKLILDKFAGCSGLKINYSKSSVTPINLPDAQASSLATSLGCPVKEFPLNYLGLPLSPKRLRRADYMPLIERISKRLADWKGQTLSRGGRLILINSVLLSIPAFFCSLFKLPTWVLNIIDKFRRHFFWRGRMLRNGFQCLVTWEHVCRPKKLGGLGIRSLRIMNLALLMKVLWNFYTYHNLPWVKLLMQKHYRYRHPAAEVKSALRCCPIWKGILDTAPSLHASTTVVLGSGHLTSFWNARWSGGLTLRHQFPNLYAASTHRNLSVAKWIQRFAHNIDLGFGTGLGRDQQQEDLPRLQVLLQNTSLTNDNDSISWRWHADGRFQVRRAYNFLIYDGVNTNYIPCLWTIKIPLRVKIFMWLAARNKILTADTLAKRGWVGPSICTLCSRSGESLQHIFFYCSYSTTVWTNLLQHHLTTQRALLALPGDLPTRWNRARISIKGRRHRRGFDTLLTTICWELWKERNKRIFDNQLSRSGELERKVIDTMALWQRALGT